MPTKADIHKYIIRSAFISSNRDGSPNISIKTNNPILVYKQITANEIHGFTSDK